MGIEVLRLLIFWLHWTWKPILVLISISRDSLKTNDAEVEDRLKVLLGLDISEVSWDNSFYEQTFLRFNTFSINLILSGTKKATTVYNLVTLLFNLRAKNLPSWDISWYFWKEKGFPDFFVKFTW